MFVNWLELGIEGRACIQTSYSSCSNLYLTVAPDEHTSLTPNPNRTSKQTTAGNRQVGMNLNDRQIRETTSWASQSQRIAIFRLRLAKPFLRSPTFVILMLHNQWRVEASSILVLLIHKTFEQRTQEPWGRLFMWKSMVPTSHLECSVFFGDYVYGRPQVKSNVITY